MVEFCAVKLGYSSDAPSAKSGMFGGKLGVDLSPLDEYLDEGWRVHTFSFDEDGCWQEAILVREEHT